MTLQQQLTALMAELGTEYIDIAIHRDGGTIYAGKEAHEGTLSFGPAFELKTLDQAIAEIKGGAA